jgi:hypothetical protein
MEKNNAELLLGHLIAPDDRNSQPAPVGLHQPYRDESRALVPRIHHAVQLVVA